MDDDEHEHSFGLILSLDGRSRDFVLGVEMGRLWEQLKTPESFEQTIHAENLEIVMRMMEGADRKMRVEDCATDETYCYLIVEEALVDA
jgi:hypothetical protein